jgi:hypothetical protein
MVLESMVQREIYGTKLCELTANYTVTCSCRGCDGCDM